MEKEPKPKRISMALRNDLNERVFQKAAELKQNPNFFVNQIIEGVLDAMDAGDTSEDIPILTLNRLMKDRPCSIPRSSTKSFPCFPTRPSKFCTLKMARPSTRLNHGKPEQPIIKDMGVR